MALKQKKKNVPQPWFIASVGLVQHHFFASFFQCLLDPDLKSSLDQQYRDLLNFFEEWAGQVTLPGQLQPVELLLPGRMGELKRLNYNPAPLKQGFPGILTIRTDKIWISLEVLDSYWNRHWEFQSTTTAPFIPQPYHQARVIKYIRTSM